MVPLYGSKIRFTHEPGSSYFGLSNSAPSPFLHRGRVWPTVDHYYHAHKFEDLRSQEQVRLSSTAYDARKLARGLPGIRPGWEQERESFMLTGLHDKFTQHDKYYRLLVSTGHRPLEFALPSDVPVEVALTWGVDESGKGENRLGKQLVRLRDTYLPSEEGYQLPLHLDDPLRFANSIATASRPSDLTPDEEDAIAKIKAILDEESGSPHLHVDISHSEAHKWRSMVLFWDRPALNWWREEARERKFVAALKLGDGKTVREFVEDYGMSVTELQDPDGHLLEWTPLAVAARRNRVHVCRYLVSMGAAVDGLNGQYYPPLHWAIFSGAVGAVEFLLSAGASVGLVNRDGRDALQASEFAFQELKRLERTDDSRNRDRASRAESIRELLKARVGLGDVQPKVGKKAIM